jgi:hypothetical protein
MPYREPSRRERGRSDLDEKVGCRVEILSLSENGIVDQTRLGFQTNRIEMEFLHLF